MERKSPCADEFHALRNSLLDLCRAHPVLDNDPELRTSFNRLYSQVRSAEMLAKSLGLITNAIVDSGRLVA